MAIKHAPVLLYLGTIGSGTLIEASLDITGMGMDANTDDYLASDSPNGVREFTTVGFTLRDVTGECGFSEANWLKLQTSFSGSDTAAINIVIGKGTDQRKLVMAGKVTSFNVSQAGADKTGRISFTLKFNPVSGKTDPHDQVDLAAMA